MTVTLTDTQWDEISSALARCSVHGPESLKLADAALYGMKVYPAAGRALPGWEEEATNAVARRMAECGFDVTETHSAEEMTEDEESPTGAPVVGGVTIRWQGMALLCAIRIDAAAEVFPRVSARHA